MEDDADYADSGHHDGHGLVALLEGVEVEDLDAADADASC